MKSVLIKALLKCLINGERNDFWERIYQLLIHLAFARCYGFRKIYKKNYPFRLLISIINFPFKDLKQNHEVFEVF